MKIYEKAIENYAKKRKEFYNDALKQDIADFNEKIEKMTADGRCPGIACQDCHVHLLNEYLDNDMHCGVVTTSERRELLAREVEE